MADQTRTPAAADAPDSTQNEKLTADENWARYEYGRDRGHTLFCKEVRRLEDVYLGGGSQCRLGMAGRGRAEIG